MKNLIRGLTVLSGMGVILGAQADAEREVQGEVQSIDSPQASLVVEGVTIHTDERTDFDDDYRSFADIKTGDGVEVDYVVRDGRNVATEIERDD